ncbi:MAG TPA: transglycosylase SLT domain-containing protein [Burkholderiales bacterium]|nr:transglycosylase SLT domain-containing protein [Burkholderiales bacterium]
MELASNLVVGGAGMRLPGLSGVIRLLSLARGVFALIGLSAVLAVAVPTSRDLLMRQADAIARANQSVAESATLAAGTIQVGVPPAQSKQDQEAVTAFIAKRYRVADEAVAGFVSVAYRAGRQFAVDPLLILAVMAVESRYNPVAESGVGAKGLMQVLPRFHLDKLEAHGGEEALLDPDVNIEVGTQILREYLRRFGETVTALQMYAGAMDEPNADYANKVLAERSRLQSILRRQRSKG